MPHMDCCRPTNPEHFDCWGDVFGYRLQQLQSYEVGATKWSQRSRHEYYTLYPHYMLGTIADRNHAVTRDLSGLTSLS